MKVMFVPGHPYIDANDVQRLRQGLNDTVAALQRQTAR